MREPTSDMLSELAAWNGVEGIGLKSWLACSGNFSLAIGYAEVFWPQFVEIDDLVVRSSVTLQSLEQSLRDNRGNKSSVEWVHNHVHLADIHYVGCPDISAEKLRRLGHILVEIHEAKLKWQFPDRQFTVKYYEPDDKEFLQEYQIAFWQPKHELPPT